MKKLALLLLAFPLTAFYVGNNAMAADCAPPTLINSLPMEEVPGSGTMTVTATFDGSPERLLVGIGDVPTTLWNAQAVKLDLPVWEGRRTMDAGGRFTEDVSRIETFKLGNMETGNFNIPIIPDPDYANSGTDGALGTNMMQRYDIRSGFCTSKTELLLARTMPRRRHLLGAKQDYVREDGDLCRRGVCAGDIGWSHHHRPAGYSRRQDILEPASREGFYSA